MEGETELCTSEVQQWNQTIMSNVISGIRAGHSELTWLKAWVMTFGLSWWSEIWKLENSVSWWRRGLEPEGVGDAVGASSPMLILLVREYWDGAPQSTNNKSCTTLVVWVKEGDVWKHWSQNNMEKSRVNKNESGRDTQTCTMEKRKNMERNVQTCEYNG